MIHNKTTPMKGFKGRKTGDHKTPEGVNNGPIGSIPTYPGGNVPMPGQRVKGGPSGDAKSNSQPNKQVNTMIAKGNPGGAGKPTGSTSGPFRRKGGSDKSKL